MHTHPEQKQCKKEAKILRLLEVLRMYADFLRDLRDFAKSNGGDASLTGKGCGGPLRLAVALDKGQSVLLCGKFSQVFFYIIIPLITMG